MNEIHRDSWKVTHIELLVISAITKVKFVVYTKNGRATKHTAFPSAEKTDDIHLRVNIGKSEKMKFSWYNIFDQIEPPLKEEYHDATVSSEDPMSDKQSISNFSS